MKKICLTVFLMVLLLSVSAGCIVIQPPGAPADAAGPGTSAPEVSAAPQATVAPTAAPTPVPTPPPTPTPVPLPVVGDRKNQYSTPHVVVDIHCPNISGMQDTAMQSGINSGVYDFLNTRASALETQSVQDETNYGAHAPYTFGTTFDVMRNDGDILSVLIKIQQYEGGAHPSFEHATINAVNSNPGDQLLLADLFEPCTDYTTMINNEINAMIAADSAINGVFWFSGISAHQTFYLKSTHLVILFEPYTIAPGAYGAPEFEIPLGNLSNLVIH